MNNIKLISQKKQDSKKEKYFENRKRERVAFNSLTIAHASAISELLMKKRKFALFRAFNYLLQNSRNGRENYASLAYLCERVDIKHVSTLSKIMHELASLGYISIEWRFFGASVRYCINPIFNSPEVQHAIRHLFPFLQRLFLISLLMVSPSMSGKILNGNISHLLKKRLVRFKEKDPKLEVIRNNIIYLPQAVAESREDSSWTFGEKMSGEIERVYGTLQEKEIPNKRVAQEVFGCLNDSLEAISDSFILPSHGYGVTSHKDRVVEREQVMAVPYMDEESGWEEVDDFLVSDSPKKEEIGNKKEEPLYSYYPRLDEYTELNMTPFGKMKLSVIPEGIIFTGYNYFKSRGKVPSYHKFLASCIEHTKLLHVDLKPRWRRFFEVCKLRAIDPENTPVTVVKEFVLERSVIEDTEEGFWKVELHKLTPQGQQVMNKLGDPHNPYRRRMIDLDCIRNRDMFDLYLAAYPFVGENGLSINPLEPAVRNQEAYEVYRDALSSSILGI